jgi:hypothetical protein
MEAIERLLALEKIGEGIAEVMAEVRAVREHLSQLELVRDGTIVAPGGSEIDLRTSDEQVWITIKGPDARVEKVAGLLLNVFPEKARLLQP